MIKKDRHLMALVIIVWGLVKVGQMPFFLVRLFIFANQYIFKFLYFKIIKRAVGVMRRLNHLISKALDTKVVIPFFNSANFKPVSKPILKKVVPVVTNVQPFWVFFRRVRLTILLALMLGGLIGYSIILVSIAHDLPSPERLASLQTPSTTQFLDRSGKLLYRLYEGRNRTIITLDGLPKDLINATIAIEDKHYYQHKGVDINGVARSILVLIRDHQLQGGSTITQQLIKNTLLTTERTWQRKLREMVLAVWTERLYNKDQILAMYFNEVPYGGPAWGIEAAAETYFKKNAQDLSLAESAYLAGLPVSPTTYSPFGTDPQKGMERQKDVLKKMLEQGYINQGEYQQAINTPLNFSEPVNDIKAPHFVMYLRSVLAQKYGERMVSQGGLKITTTLDLNIQQKVEDILTDELSKLTALRVGNGAAMVMDPKSGQILAMVGSKNYFDKNIGNFNVAISPRQPGSSIKPITYATAFKAGYSPGNILLDTPTSFKNQWETYSPVNYDGHYHGVVTIRTALGSSYNVPAVKMLALIGVPNMIATAKDLGITTFGDTNRFGLALTLGGGEVKLIDMIGAYSTFANNGVHFEPQGILKIEDSYGNVLEDNTASEGQRVLTPAVAYLINNILSDNSARTPAFGPNSLLRIPGHSSVAVKTGTTDLKRDNWTFGYTPEVVVGVWVGNNDNVPMDPQLSSGVSGAAPIWNRVMTTLLEGKGDLAFYRPPEIIESMVDGRKDLAIAGVSNKSAVAMGHKKQKDGEKEKEVITFSDPFSRGNLVPVNIPNTP